MGRDRAHRGWTLGQHRGQWVCRINGSRITTGVPATEANKAKAEIIAANIAHAEKQATGGDTVDEILALYLADMDHPDGRQRTSQAAYYARNPLLSVFGGLAPSQITREGCRVYSRLRVNDGVTPATVRRELGVLAAALRRHDPLTPAVIELPSASPPRDRWLERDEVRAVLDEAQHHARLYIQLAVATGARREAILSLDWHHIDLIRKRVAFQPKDGGKKRAREVPLTESAMKALQSVPEELRGGPVIMWRGKRVKTLRKALERAFERAGIDHGGNPHHVFRHTSGVWMAQAGVSMEEIADRLGHSDIRVTRKHYARFHPDYMDKSTDALEL
ncbi:MAG: site-specific integrase [Pseudomonadota bacterium]